MISGAVGAIEYRVVLLHRGSEEVWVACNHLRHHLPRVGVRRWERPVPQLRRAFRDIWDLRIWILDLLHVDSDAPWAIAEAPSVADSPHFKPVGLDTLGLAELSGDEKAQLVLQHGRSDNPLARVGWMDEAIDWIETVTRGRVRSRQDVDQINAGFGFALLRCRLDGAQDCWLKATGAPNTHELPVTHLLSQLGGNYLPSFLDAKPAWNAWLMGGDCHTEPPLVREELLALTRLQIAVKSMAELQLKTAGHAEELLGAGAFDQRSQTFLSTAAQAFEYLESAMERQTSQKSKPISRRRLRELRNILEDACGAMGALQLPDCIVHGDMSWNNIVYDGASCRFIDWAEAYIGNPLITFQHLLLLDQGHKTGEAALRDMYRTALGTVCDLEAINRGFAFMPLLAVYSVLYGRGDWMERSNRDDLHREAYARTLARCMDRAAREPSLLDALRTPSATLSCPSSISSMISRTQAFGVTG